MSKYISFNSGEGYINIIINHILVGFRGHITGHITKDFRFDLVRKSSFFEKNLTGQNPEKPCVAGSIPALSTFFI